MNHVMPNCFEHRSVIQSGIDAATPPSDLLAGAHRTRAFNVAHLMEFVAVRLDAQYVSRFTMATNGTLWQST